MQYVGIYIYNIHIIYKSADVHLHGPVSQKQPHLQNAMYYYDQWQAGRSVVAIRRRFDSDVEFQMR